MPAAEIGEVLPPGKPLIEVYGNDSQFLVNYVENFLQVDFDSSASVSVKRPTVRGSNIAFRVCLGRPDEAIARLIIRQ